ncbi:MAG TPA: glutathione S-transferase C-terminal domain-containing protein, partial [Rhodospirillales bacterium]|nr:glutathione S-transferase C-terminal domain-containing protein [Rhodospirillales bacterium]
PEFLAMNPNGLVPVLEDASFVLWESNAIIRYVAEVSGGPPLYPADPETRAIANQWMGWSNTAMNTPLVPLFVGMVRTAPEDRDAGAIERARLETARHWAMLDAHLADRAFVAGDAFSIGDIPLGASAYRWFPMDIERPDHANVHAWYERLAERPAYREHVMLPLS